ncbi:hypothetical protein Lal_00021716 [Lupinus albus]|nr:hypothetical protein Lal_00021716 [Lupinus albus]
MDGIALMSNIQKSSFRCLAESSPPYISNLPVENIETKGDMNKIATQKRVNPVYRPTTKDKQKPDTITHTNMVDANMD